MSTAARKIRSLSSSGTIVPFPSFGVQQTRTIESQNQPTTIEATWRAGISAVDLRREIEMAVHQFVQRQSWSLLEYDDPFDAVYIADLEMDSVSRADIQHLRKFSTIQDRSDEIQFPEE